VAAEARVLLLQAGDLHPDRLGFEVGRACRLARSLPQLGLPTTKKPQIVASAPLLATYNVAA
jgi:hypothetical protein